MTDSWDPAAFTAAQRSDWQVASPGWRKWYEMLEAGGEIVSRKLVELAGIGPGDTVLDVATGYGEPALTAARVVGPTGTVVATDIADGMLAFGRERAALAQLDNVEFVEADAQTLSFGEETFDAIVCRHGLQFLPDLSGTLQRWRAFLKRDSRLAVSVWGPPDTVQFARPLSVIRTELGLPAPPPGRPGIFALADRPRLARLVADAGFRDVTSGTVTAVYETNSAAEFTQWPKTSPHQSPTSSTGSHPRPRNGSGRRSPTDGRPSRPPIACDCLATADDTADKSLTNDRSDPRWSIRKPR